MKTRAGNRATEVLTAQQMRKLEADAIAAGRVCGRAMMEQAGRGVVDATLARWPHLAARPGRAVVLCGPGNNGGDGYVVARHLAARGWQAACYALGDPARLPPDARANHDAWAAEGTVAPLAEAPAALAGADLVVDALFGIGLARGLGPEVLAAFYAVPAAAHRVAVDVPSGRETDTGAVLGQGAFPADLVVTFHARKPVHAALAGEGVETVVVDIGL